MMKARFVLLVTLAVAGLLPTPAYAHAGWWDWLDALSGPGPFDHVGLDVDLRLFCGFDNDNPVVKPKPNLKPNVVDQDGHAVYGDQRIRDNEWVPFFGHSDRTQRPVRKVTSQPDGKRTKYIVRDELESACLKYSDQADRWLEIRYGTASTGEQPLFNDAPNEFIGTLRVQNVQFSVMRRIDPVIAVGAGGGFLWFTGTPRKNESTPILTGSVVKWVVTPISIIVNPLRIFPTTVENQRRWTGIVNLRADAILIGTSDAKDFNVKSTSNFHSGRELIMSLGISFDVSQLISLW